MPSLVLHTIGAKSGVEHNTPLMYRPEGDGHMLVMGSNFALETHPAGDRPPRELVSAVRESR